ncbi:uncharacterized protein LOC131673926 [Phymastichus coffea]|uniref:uncharacterized protein LOC131673926 n=1 Tax=Phymastichus coffea TaxID=108790 RepID=UPI00273C6506|nr:uncharacterized protein LOC131673926 [Phymastichus coffea]
MRLTLSTLPQLAVLAKILCLLMVVMCGAVPSTVPSVSLYSTCSRGNVTVMKQVRSMKQNDHNAPYQLLTTITENILMKMFIYAEEVDKYICFNKRWKIVAKKNKDEMCQFHEVYSGRYLRYRSAVDPTRFLGFNKLGKAIAKPRGSTKCYNFLKINPNGGVAQHNRLITQQQQQQQQQHHHQPSLANNKPLQLPAAAHRKSLQRSSNSLVHHQERTRHRHGWRRRQHLRQQQQLQQQQQQQQQQQHAMRPYQESKY